MARSLRSCGKDDGGVGKKSSMQSDAHRPISRLRGTFIFSQHTVYSVCVCVCVFCCDVQLREFRQRKAL